MTPSSNVRSTVTDDGVVLLEVSTGKMFHANAIGSLVWTKLLAGFSPSVIVADISEQFAMPPEVIEHDVHDYINALQAEGLLRES